MGLGEVASWEKEREKQPSLTDKVLRNHTGSTFVTTMTRTLCKATGRQRSLCFSLGSPEEMSNTEKLETRNISMLLKKKVRSVQAEPKLPLRSRKWGRWQEDAGLVWCGCACVCASVGQGTAFLKTVHFVFCCCFAFCILDRISLYM